MSNEIMNLPATAGGDVIFGGAGEKGPAYWIAAFIKAARTENTRRTRISDLNDAARVLEADVPDLLDLTVEGVLCYRDRLAEMGQAPATIHRKLCTIRGLFKYAIARGYRDRNPADPALAPPPRVPDVSSSDWLTMDESRALLRACRDTQGARGAGKVARALRDEAMILTMLIHGLRASELVNMSPAEPEDSKRRPLAAWFGSEDDTPVLKVRGKGGKVRRHPAHPDVRQAVGDYLRQTGRGWNDRGPLWFSHFHTRSRPMRREVVWHMLRRRCKQAGITKTIGPHSLRHSAITYAIEGGANMARVAEYAGHASINTTARYWRSRDELEQSPVHSINLAC